MKTIAHRLAFARGLAGISARQLGLFSGLSTATVGLIESGDRPNPESATVAALAQALGVSMDWLIGGSGPEPSADVVRRAIDGARRRYVPEPEAAPASDRVPTVPPDDEKAASTGTDGDS